MASNYTENYGLCQWESTDQVLREEFNQDNKKVDSVLKGTADLAQAAQALAQAAYSPENSPFMAGSYTGDGAAKRKIELGFTPQAVLVIKSDGDTLQHATGASFYWGGLAVAGVNCALSVNGTSSWVSGNTIISLCDFGFYVSYVKNGSTECSTNRLNSVYVYVALK